MKAFLFIILFPALSFASDMKIFSMNLHCGLGDWKGRMNSVVEEIVRVNPDVIGLQEVCYNDEMNMATYIRSELDKAGYKILTAEAYDTHRSFLKYQEQLLILSKHKHDEVLTGELPGVSILRNGYVAIRLENLWFITSHFHFALPMIRKSQYKFIDQKFGKAKAIIFGDLNSNPENGETNVFKLSGWEFFFDGPTYPSSNPDKTFDGFWMTKAFHNEVLSTAIDRHFMNSRNQPSDHLGISLQILFR